MNFYCNPFVVPTNNRIGNMSYNKFNIIALMPHQGVVTQLVLNNFQEMCRPEKFTVKWYLWGCTVTDTWPRNTLLVLCGNHRNWISAINIARIKIKIVNTVVVNGESTILLKTKINIFNFKNLLQKFIIIFSWRC